MKLYHVTHRSNLTSILATGLDPQRAKNVRKYKTAIWYTVEGVGNVPVTADMVRKSNEFGKVR